MADSVDPLSLICRAMVHPNDDIALGNVGGTNRQRRPTRPDNNQRAGRINANALDIGRIDPTQPNRLADTVRDRLPNILA